MASIGISEFTYGYAFLYEQTHANWGNLKAAPILPSLQQEPEQGWDAHLPTHATDFYYQFKLTDCLSRRNASFTADGTYGGPYYRIALHRKDNASSASFCTERGRFRDRHNRGDLLQLIHEVCGPGLPDLHTSPKAIGPAGIF